MFDKDLNEEWDKLGAANTHMALIHKVNFKIEDTKFEIENDILAKVNDGTIDQNKLKYMVKYYNNNVVNADSH